jgi:hypothetical protein
MVLKGITSPQLNNFLHISERCEIAIGAGQRAAHYKIVVQPTAHK